MNEKEKLRQHINYLFQNVPMSPAVADLKEELLSNSFDRYDDLVARGMPEADAYQSVVGSIGNVDELLVSMGSVQSTNYASDWDEERRSHTALTTTIAIGLYVLAAVVFFVGIFIGEVSGIDALILLFLAIAATICIVPTCMLVYNSYRWPRYKKRSETMVEDFKQWNNNTKKNKQLKRSLSGILWLIVVIIYFMISFTTFAWHITWIVFLVGACLDSVLGLLLGNVEDKK